MQESLTNVGRHAQATTGAIALHEEGSDYVVTVSDDGRGLPEGGAEHEAAGYSGCASAPNCSAAASRHGRASTAD